MDGWSTVVLKVVWDVWDRAGEVRYRTPYGTNNSKTWQTYESPPSNLLKFNQTFQDLFDITTPVWPLWPDKHIMTIKFIVLIILVIIPLCSRENYD